MIAPGEDRLANRNSQNPWGNRHGRRVGRLRVGFLASRDFSTNRRDGSSHAVSAVRSTDHHFASNEEEYSWLPRKLGQQRVVSIESSM